MEYKFTKDNFETEVMNSDKPVLIDFYADWCMPCKMMGPVVKELEEKYDGKVKIGKINVDQEQELAAGFKVMSIPFFAVMKNGKLVDSAVGAVPKNVLEGKISSL